MNYILKKFTGFCPKNNQECTIEVAYFRASTLLHRNYLERSHSLCKCSLDCPIYKETPEKIQGI